MADEIGQLKILVFRPAYNSKGRRDVTGAFKPEAEKFVACVGPAKSRIVAIDNRKSMAARKRAVLSELEAADAEDEFFDGVAFFCHGWSTGIQLGFRTSDTPVLASAIQDICEHSFTNVPLYCCSTGRAKQYGSRRGEALAAFSSPGTGDDSFADKLRDELCAQGAEYCRVMGHTTVAHTTKNPFARFFDGMGSPVGGVGGYVPVGPKSKLWQPWRHALQQTDLRFRFPFMEVTEIHAELLA